MTRLAWLCCGMFLMLAVTETPAFACSCVGGGSFQEMIKSMPVVVVGRVTSMRLAPPPEPAPDDLAIVRPFQGTGMTLAIASVAKGEVSDPQIRIWDIVGGECGSRLVFQPVGTYLVLAG